MKYRLLATLLGLGLAAMLISLPVSAQHQASLTFNSFSGIYHLSRDAKGVSLLTTEETILADFPAGGKYSGLRREIPKTYQNHSVNVKILKVVDAAGNPIPYKTSTDKENLIVTTGDPDITLYGIQTIKISYQTRGVINLGKKNDEFLLRVNGTGWQQPFGTVNATVNISSNLGGRLRPNPTCYISPGGSSQCQINTKNNSGTTVVMAKAENVPAHRSLVMRMNFQADTFTNDQPRISQKAWLGLGVVAAITVSLGSYLLLTGRK